MYSKDELKALKLDFWESFAAFCEVQPELRDRKKIWTLYNTKVSHTELKFDLKRNRVQVAIEVNHKREDLRLEMLERLTWYKDEIERDFQPDALVWDICYVRETGKEVVRIYVETTDFDFYRRTHWGDIFRFMVNNMYLLERNFMSVAEYLRE